MLLVVSCRAWREYFFVRTVQEAVVCHQLLQFERRILKHNVQMRRKTTAGAGAGGGGGEHAVQRLTSAGGLRIDEAASRSSAGGEVGSVLHTCDTELSK